MSKFCLLGSLDRYLLFFILFFNESVTQFPLKLNEDK